jgi:hypothetical protein
MDRPEPVRATGGRRSLRSARVALVALFLLSAPAFAARSAAHDPAGPGWTAAMPTMTAQAQAPAADATPATGAAASMPGMPGDGPPADASAAWAARPDFVRVSARTEEAYAYALEHPQVIRWMPCYCGCAGMGHRSNLDCYLQRSETVARTTFEEHASYCDICVETTLLAKKMTAEGRTLREIRAAVDQTYGGAAPGTPTDLPPA